MQTTAVRSVEHDLVIERVYAAPRDLLFEVWSQPKHIVNWWGPSGYSLPFCDVDFRIGGRYRICMRSPEGEDHWVSGEYREIDEPKRIVFTWKRENRDGAVWADTIVDVSFETAGDETVFLLRQSGFDSVEHRDQHRGGWAECLDRLEDYVTVY